MTDPEPARLAKAFAPEGSRLLTGEPGPTPLPGSPFPTPGEADQLLVAEDSVTWRIASDARLYLVMLYPLLLQVAHPVVGAGVRDFSDFELRPWDRLLRTLDYVNLIVYGGPGAVAAGRRLHSIHKTFTGVREDGQRYSALEPEAYAWVHATLLRTYVVAHAHFCRPLTPPELGRFYREYRGLGRLLGVREGDLPDDWAGFCRYFDEITGQVLVRTESVDRVIRAVKRPANPLPAVTDPVWRAVRVPAAYPSWVGGIGLMAPELRARLGIAWTGTEDASFRALGAFTRRLTPLMPRRLKVLGPDQLRLRRRAIARGAFGDLPSGGPPDRT